MFVYDATRVAASLCLPAKELEGSVASLHADYLNCIVAGEVLTFFRAGCASVPFGIEVKGIEDWRSIGLEQGQQAFIGPQEFRVPAIMAVRGLADAPRFLSSVGYGVCHPGPILLERLKKLHAICLSSPNFGGILAFLGSYQPLDGWKYDATSTRVFENRLQASFEALLNGTTSGDDFLIVEGVHGLLGLGPGLTPSGDDFLLGFLAGLKAAGTDPTDLAPAKLARCLVNDAPRCTTTVSVAFLKYAAQGQYHQYLIKLIELFRSGNEAEMTVAARKLLTLGHFSGTDLLLGFSFGGFAALWPDIKGRQGNENL